jgi:hypothetical protein|tara:strand:- start:351 stop:725 length:375 start_codon:yes stop_codon:yes gene_type:complete
MTADQIVVLIVFVYMLLKSYSGGVGGKFIIFTCIIVFISSAFGPFYLPWNKPKYTFGDCITPTDPIASWYGEFAMVREYDLASIFGPREDQYILKFERYNSNTNEFSRRVIEPITVLVGFENCL